MTQAEYYKNNEYDVKKSGGKKWEQHPSFERKKLWNQMQQKRMKMKFLISLHNKNQFITF